MDKFEKYNPKPMGDNIDNWRDIGDANWDTLQRIDEAQKEAGTILGRIVQVGYADGRAVYQIVNVTPRTATVQVCTQIGDDWVLPMWGRKSTVPLRQVMMYLS